MRAIFRAPISWAFYLEMLVFCLGILSQAATLSITGNATGQGFQNMSYTGDGLNVSILVITAGCFWNVTGMM